MTIADCLRQSASVSRLICFHTGLRNRSDRKESAKVCKEGNDSELSVSRSRATWIVLLLLEEMLSFLLDSNEHLINS